MIRTIKVSKLVRNPGLEPSWSLRAVSVYGPLPEGITEADYLQQHGWSLAPNGDHCKEAGGYHYRASMNPTHEIRPLDQLP